MRSLAVMLLVALGSACASAPPVRRVDMPTGARVGYVVDLPAEAQHVHVGTTVFANFTSKGGGDWGLPAQVGEELARQLAQRGFEPVDLGGRGFSGAELAGLVTRSRGACGVAEGREAVARRLGEERVDAVVLVTSGAKEQVGTGTFVTQYGLLSESFLGLNDYWAVPWIDERVYALAPCADLSDAHALDFLHWTKSERVSLEHYSAPADLKNLSEAEWRPVREAVEARARQAAAAAAQAIAGS